MRYGSVCSGIEAATKAWHVLGWEPSFFSEIEAFPSAVLNHHYPSVPNLGDMTKFEEWPDHAIDLLVGGTPCQDYSVAGLRAGMDGIRGSLTLTYAAIARRYRPRWVAWENVPGVLSLNGGRDFASLLGLLSGQRIEVPRDGWRNAGVVPGYHRAYGLAWRVLDAQYIRVDGFGRAVPQRRRRVFVVGYLGDWRRAAAVLLERNSLCGDSAPSRTQGKDVAPTISARPTGGGGLGTDFDLDGGLTAKPLLAGGHGNNPLDENLISFPLTSGMAASAARMPHEQGALLPICFNSREDPEVTWDRTGPLGASSPQSQAIAIQAGALRENPSSGPDGIGVQADIAYTVEARSEVQAVAFDMRGREGGAMPEGPHQTANIRAADGGSSRSYVAEQWAVRRLTPRECERLQGFPDDFTAIPYRNRLAADGPRYKALGNSMAVNVMRWIGQRIQQVENLSEAA